MHFYIFAWIHFTDFYIARVGGYIKNIIKNSISAYCKHAVRIWGLLPRIETILRPHMTLMITPYVTESSCLPFALSPKYILYPIHFLCQMQLGGNLIAAWIRITGSIQEMWHSDTHTSQTKEAGVTGATVLCVLCPQWCYSYIM